MTSLVFLFGIYLNIWKYKLYKIGTRVYLPTTLANYDASVFWTLFSVRLAWNSIICARRQNTNRQCVYSFYSNHFKMFTYEKRDCIHRMSLHISLGWIAILFKPPTHPPDGNLPRPRFSSEGRSLSDRGRWVDGRAPFSGKSPWGRLLFLHTRGDYEIMNRFANIYVNAFAIPPHFLALRRNKNFIFA